MSIEYSTWSLGIYGAVFGAALIFTLRVTGESKFGSEQLRDLCKLRPKILQNIRRSLGAHLRPVIDRAIVGAAPRLILPGSETSNMPSQGGSLSEEALENALRDFVKADVEAMVDLRDMQVTYERLLRAVRRFRNTLWTTTALSAIGALLATAMKGGLFDLTIAWPHFVGFGIVALSIAIAIWFLLWIGLALNRTDRLLSKYADLS